MGLTSHPYPHPLPVLGLRTEVFEISAHPSSLFPPLRKPILEICFGHCFWTGLLQWWAGAQGLLSATTLPNSGLVSSEPPGQKIPGSQPQGFDAVARMRSANQHVFAFQKTSRSSRGSALLPGQPGTLSANPRKSCRNKAESTALPTVAVSPPTVSCVVSSWFLEVVAFSLGKVCVHVPAFVCVCVCAWNLHV